MSIERLKELREQITPGEWETWGTFAVRSEDGTIVAHVANLYDAEYIVLAHNDLPEILAAEFWEKAAEKALERLQLEYQEQAQQLTAAKERVERLEKVAQKVIHWCDASWPPLNINDLKQQAEQALMPSEVKDGH